MVKWLRTLDCFWSPAESADYTRKAFQCSVCSERVMLVKAFRVRLCQYTKEKAVKIT